MASLAATWNQMDKRQQYIVLIAVPVLLAVLLGYLSWGVLAKIGPKPGLLIKREGGVYSEIEGLDAQIVEKETIIAKEPSIDAQLKSLQDDIAEAEERLPLEAEKSQMRELIEKLARSIPSSIGTVQFKSVSIKEGPKDRDNKKEYQAIGYQIEISGDLHGIIKYIDSIEKNTRYMAVRTLSIRPGETTIDNNKVVVNPHTVSMELITYYYDNATRKKRK
ncbi:MAG: type 4a pilus biogenesis protein PilO [Solirubrobacterales bacterium]|nr:type 4a pilus biogenesis protein PilO [Solirubrobacterales bacterium]